MSYKLCVDTMKGYISNKGDMEFFQSEEQFIDYLRNKLGNDFADALVEQDDLSADLEELYFDVNSAIEDTAIMETETRNPISKLKQYKKNTKLLEKCLDFLESEWEDRR